MLLLVLLIQYLITFVKLEAVNADEIEQLQNIFLGRCWNYQLIEWKTMFPPGKQINCSTLWEKFYNAVKKAKSTDNPLDIFNAFVNGAAHVIPTDKSLFWSGLKKFVMEFGDIGRRYFILEATLAGYIMNDFPLDNLLPKKEKPKDLTHILWRALSKKFAELANGNVHVILNGTRGNPFNKTNFFGKVEFPMLTQPKVKKLTVLLLFDLTDDKRTAKCGKGSLLELKTLVLKKNIEFDCVENPLSPKHLLCVDAPHNWRCKFKDPPSCTAVPLGVIIGIDIIILLCVMVIIALLVFLKAKSSVVPAVVDLKEM